MNNFGTELAESCYVYGQDHAKSIVMLGPVTPTWSGGEFCAPLIDRLLALEYQVVVVDSLYFLNDDNDECEPDKIIERIALFIQKHISNVVAVAGYALGGTIAVKLAERLPNCPRILSLSGPGFMDSKVRNGLEALVDLLKSGNLQGCLTLLSQFVAPEGSSPGISHKDNAPEGNATQLACLRMMRGFQFLLKLDARNSHTNYDGKLLCIVGEYSQLATRENQAIKQNAEEPNKQLICVPGAGMRILMDNSALTVACVEKWLSDEK